MRNSIFVLYLLITYNCLSQQGFKEQIALEDDEPNAGFHVLEDTINKQYLVSGQYFDQEIGRWTAFVSKYDLNGEIDEIFTLRNDTVPILSQTNHSVLFDNKYYMVGRGLSTTDIVVYNTLTNEVNVDKSIERFRTNNIFNKNLSFWSFEFSPIDSLTLIAGVEVLDDEGIETNAAVFEIGNRNRIFTNGSELKDQSALGIRKNSKGEFVVATLNSERPLNATKDTTYLYFLDTDLNLIRSTLSYTDNPNFRLGKGMAIDGEDNIVVTGAQHSPGGSSRDARNLQGVVKFDSEGNYLWTSYISNSINNVSGWGKWHSIVESSQKDGYVIAGAESYQTPSEDTIISRAAIAKLSYDGDSLWMHTYSYREGPRLQEAFHDITATSDGGYIAVGSSAHFDALDESLLPWIRTIILKVDKDGILDTTLVSSINLTEDDQNSIVIYPNPVKNDKLFITQSLDERLQLSIRNIQGQLMDSYRSDNAKHTIILDVAAYDPGMYVVTAINDQGHKYSRKFVVE
mgnify:CR=1 FL=1